MYPTKLKLINGTTATVTNWFKNLFDKHKHKFIKSGIAEFYPLILNKSILNKSIKYAKSFLRIEDNAISTTKLARKSLAFNKDMT